MFPQLYSCCTLWENLILHHLSSDWFLFLFICLLGSSVSWQKWGGPRYISTWGSNSMCKISLFFADSRHHNAFLYLFFPVIDVRHSSVQFCMNLDTLNGRVLRTEPISYFWVVLFLKSKKILWFWIDFFQNIDHTVKFLIEMKAPSCSLILKTCWFAVQTSKGDLYAKQIQF